MKTVIVLPDGRKISSGDPGQTAVRSCTVTGRVNEGQELTPGSCCAAMLEAELILAGADCPISAGDMLTVLQDTVPVGVFRAEKPRRNGQLCRVTGYDPVVLLDRELDTWLKQLDGWPYPLEEFARMVAGACGVPLHTEQMVNKGFPVRKFSCTGATGRQLMRWAAELGCCFCRADTAGQLQLQWYTPAEKVLTPGGSYYYYENSLKCQEYQVKAIEKVQIRRDISDLGVLWPNREEACNTLRITGNFLTADGEASQLRQAAQEIFTRLRDLTYTPCGLTVPWHQGLQPGQMLQVTDPVGRTLTMLIMEQVQRDFRLQLSCTGSPRRDSVSAVNDRSIRSVSGRLLRLQTDMDGIRAENRDMQGGMAAMTLELEQIGTVVRSGQLQTRQQLDRVVQEQTDIRQQATQVEIAVQTIAREGVDRVVTGSGYRFDSEGLHISKAGQEIVNRMDNTGMFVERAGKPLLSAGASGVRAADLQAENYLIIGEHTRLEDYSDGLDSRRTACFSI